MTWQTTIGLEVHVQLKTKSKLFSRTNTEFGAEPNTQASIIDLALPGVLPVLNKEAVVLAVKLGKAIDATIAKTSIFARKNYFYPDLPKGYQISQYELPIVQGGTITITLPDNTQKTIQVERAHLEEDAGKSLHEDFHGESGIDLNRAGTPLLEIVSKPDLKSAEEAVAYLKTLHSLVRYLDVSDGNMQEGSFRCDVNISVNKPTDKELGTRAEIKNVNSFKFVEKSIHYEVSRQIALLESGQQVVQETRLFDPQKNETRSMRSKEDAHDYRYFPDPDLLPVILDQEFIDNVTMPELPKQKLERFIKDYQLTAYDATVLTSTKELATFFEEAVKVSTQPKLTANWVTGELLGALNKQNLNITESPIDATNIGTLVLRIHDKTISGKIAKTIFESLWQTPSTTDQVIKDQGLVQLTDSSQIAAIIDEVIANNPKQVEDYRGGKDRLFGFFVGQTMKASKGRANPDQVNKLLKEKLS